MLKPESLPYSEYADEKDGASFTRYAALIRALRGPDGCPWDQKQTLQSLRSFLVEETFELVGAINDGDSEHVREEIGDLFLVLMLTASAYEKRFGVVFSEILEDNFAKLVRRHPHVFGDSVVENSEQVIEQWNRIKKHNEGRENHLVQDAGQGLPPLLHALEIQKAAAKLGFDWPNVAPVFAKLREETAELEQEVRNQPQTAGKLPTASTEKELGDLLFAVVNAGRKLKISPALALERSSASFLRRFGHVQARMSEENRLWEETDLQVLDSLWEEAKSLE